MKHAILLKAIGHNLNLVVGANLFISVNFYLNCKWIDLPFYTEYLESNSISSTFLLGNRQSRCLLFSIDADELLDLFSF